MELTFLRRHSAQIFKNFQTQTQTQIFIHENYTKDITIDN